VSGVVIEPIPDLAAARQDWSDLADAAGSPFSTWEWADVWYRHLGGGRPLLLHRCRAADGRVAAILPLYLSTRRPARTLRLLGHGPADQLAPVCAPADRDLAAAGLRRALDERVGGWQVAVLDRLPGDESWSEPIGGRVVHRESSPALVAEGRDWEAFLASRSRNFRDQARRRERRLAREHDLSFRLSDDPERLDADLDTLLRLHDARWEGGTRSFVPPLDALHRDFARAALGRGWLRLWLLELGGHPAAVWLGYRMGGVEWYYQAGRDPAFEREAVGFVLMNHTIREALNDGMREYRLLIGGEGYKDRYANADRGVETAMLSRGPRGAAAVAGARLARRVPTAARRRLKRLAG
jgi:CelD/BcsL family acetyltransferase involved in cellulose biosynthesis